MTTDEAMLAGAQFTRSHLAIIDTAYGAEVAMAYAGGMASAVRNSVAAKHGARCAYDLYSGLADDLITQQARAG